MFGLGAKKTLRKEDLNEHCVVVMKPLNNTVKHALCSTAEKTV